MKKILLCGAVAVGCCLASVAQSKINNVGRLRLMEFAEMKADMARKAPGVAVEAPKASVIVRMNPGASVADLEAEGYKVLDSVDDMAIVEIGLDAVDGLAAHDMVRGIDFGYQARPLMDEARRLSFADAAHAGSEGLDKSYKGEGVYVGLYDTGLDPNHVNFTDGNGNTRVKAVYKVTNSVVQRNESADQIASFSTDSDKDTHGTHVLGIIAGSDNVNGEYGVKNGSTSTLTNGIMPYYGVAPKADIIVGCGSFDTGSILAGVGAVIDRAKKDGKPVVVNLSLGHNRGSHDPNESQNAYLDRRAADAIIVVAAGNEGGSDMSVEKNLRGTGAGNRLNTFMVPSAGSMAQAYYSAEFWAEDDRQFTATLVLYNTAEKKIAASLPLTGKSGSKQWTPNDNSVFKKAYTSSSSVGVSWGVDDSSNRFNVQLNCNLQSSGAMPIEFGINITGPGDAAQRVTGYCDAYEGYSQSEVVFASKGMAGYISGSDKGSINGMACGTKTISVGAWVSRNSMPTLGGNNTSYTGAGNVGDIANFSSYGKSGDGRQLPVVCAPGAQIVSSVSNYYVNKQGTPKTRLIGAAEANGKLNPYDYMQGTSMACPFVTGTLALWLEACPGMRAPQALEIINKTSTKDNFTAKNTDKWGAGKINVLEGLKEAIKMNASISTTLADNADQNLIVLTKEGKQLEISVPGVNNLSCKLYSLQGAEVAQTTSATDNAALDAAHLSNGIYVLSVNAAGQNLSRKVVLK